MDPIREPTSGLTREGVALITGKTLTTQQRKNLPKSAFVFPEKAPDSGSYPIHDRTHAANALSRAKGTADYATVKRKVCSRYPDLPACKGDD
jgi:hypothetical protein